MVWAHGQSKCGVLNDMTLFKLKLQNMLNKIELIVANRSYTHHSIFTPNSESNILSEYQVKCLVSRHETFNRLPKQFKVFAHPFRHAVQKNGTVFSALYLI